MDLVTRLNQPFLESALVHIGAQGRHGEFGHGQSTARYAAATMSAV